MSVDDTEVLLSLAEGFCKETFPIFTLDLIKKQKRAKSQQDSLEILSAKQKMPYHYNDSIQGCEARRGKFKFRLVEKVQIYGDPKNNHAARKSLAVYALGFAFLRCEYVTLTRKCSTAKKVCASEAIANHQPVDKMADKTS